MRAVLGWLLLGGAIGGSLLLLAHSDYAKRQASIRAARSGQSKDCTVQSRRNTGGRTPAFFVTLDRGQDYDAIEVQVTRSTYESSRPGTHTLWYTDPFTGTPVAEIERPHRENWVPILFLTLGALGLIAFAAVRLGRIIKEMWLLRNGIELETYARGHHLRTSTDGPNVTLKPPIHREALIRVGPGGEELIVLATPTLSRSFFPHLIDVPVQNLAHEELIVPLLEPPVRRPHPGWHAWIRRKQRLWPITMVVVAIPALVLTWAAFAMSKTSTTFWISAGASVLVESVLLLAWMRAYWRDVVLWREGEEVHAIILEERWEQGLHSFDVAFSYRSSEHRGRRTMPQPSSALTTQSPSDAPAVTHRVVVLVDPLRPERWSIVPQGCARHAL